jgi:adenosylcobinamide-phosphate synthase
MGPRSYEGERVAGQWMGDGRFALKAADIRVALDLYRAACGVQLGVLAILLVLTFL